MYVYRHQKLAKTCHIDLTEITQEQSVRMVRVSPYAVKVSLQKSKQCVEKNSLPNVTDLGLSAEEREKLQTLLHKHQAVFATHNEDYGRTSTIQHAIPTGKAPPVGERHRQIPPKMYQEVQGLLQGMLDSKIITPSASPWAAPIVLVHKKDGTP